MRNAPAAGSTLTLPSRSVRTSAAPAADESTDGGRGRMAIDVVAPDLDRRQARSQALQERGQPRIGAAVVGDLEDVDRS